MIRKSAFSLIELLVIVLLLSALAIVVPHISGAGEQSRSSTLSSELLTVRSKIEMYKFHHDGRLPATSGETSVDFLRRMTTQTDSEGQPGLEFGPYLEYLPVNPFNNSEKVRVDGAAAGANLGGWRFDTMTGAFQADDSPDHAMF